MKLLTLVLLFQVSIIRQHPNPSLVSGPISYWSCPVGWAVSYHQLSEEHLSQPPVCVSAHFYRAIDADKQELVFWVWKKTIPKNGILQLDWPLPWIGLPGCDIYGSLLADPERTKEYIKVRGKPEQKLVFICFGIMKREGT